MGILIFEIKCFLGCRWDPAMFVKVTVNQAVKFAFLQPKIEILGVMLILH